MVIDAHQHLWTEPLVEALAARRALPLLRRQHGDWILHLVGEPTCVIVPDERARRTVLLDQDGVDVGLVALSSALGIEALEPDAARGLIAAHSDGVRAFGARFVRWGTAPLAEPDPTDVDRLVDGGAVGLSLPAGALADPRDLSRASPLLERLEKRGAALFVHPGPSPWAATDARPAAQPGPAWWPALTTYVAQMQAAWLTVVTEGQQVHPQLRVLFALLAGGAPLNAERLAARGGPVVDLTDPRLFYDTSSHGPRALAAFGVTGAQLVHGSDRPVTPPATPPSDARATDAPSRLLGDFLPLGPGGGRMTALPDRVLLRAELRGLVADLAAEPERWRHAVHHDPQQRVFAEIARNDHVSAWVICWMPGQDTGFHDHDLSSGAVIVIDGAVRENRLCLHGEDAGARHEAGAVFDFSPSDIHRVSHAGDRPAVTLHVYSPPLARMGAYVIEPSGALQRHPMAEDAELRPLAA